MDRCGCLLKPADRTSVRSPVSTTNHQDQQSSTHLAPSQVRLADILSPRNCSVHARSDGIASRAHIAALSRRLLTQRKREQRVTRSYCYELPAADGIADRRTFDVTWQYALP